MINPAYEKILLDIKQSQKNWNSASRVHVSGGHSDTNRFNSAAPSHGNIRKVLAQNLNIVYIHNHKDLNQRIRQRNFKQLNSKWNKN